MNRLAVLIVATAGLAMQPAFAQAPKEPPAAEQAATTAYLREAALADMFEIESSKLAAERAGRPEVRELARAAVSERGAGLRRLKDLAASAQLDGQIPKAIDKDRENQLDELRKTDGASFDRTYVAMQIKAYETALTLHSSYARAAQDGPLSAHATEAAASIERHLTQLRGLGDLAPARS